MQIKVSHNLPDIEAMNRMRTLVIKMRNTYGKDISHFSDTWSNNKGYFNITVKQIKVSGNIAVLNSSIELNLNLPLAAMFFKPQIKKAIIDEIKKVL